MVADKIASESRPFTALSKESLQDAVATAEECLRRQRAGLEGSGRTDEEESVIRLEPRISGPKTVGTSWDGEEQTGKLGRGLVARMSGWMYVCEYDSCAENWRTQVVPQEQMSLLVDLYKLHIAQCHEKKTSSEDGEKLDKDQESYKEAVKLRNFEAHTDNRLDVLSPARFLPAPLQYQSIAKHQPAKQVPVWERLDLAHIGIHLADSSIVGKIHNRSYGGIQLRFFSTPNLSVNESEKDIMLKPVHTGAMRQTRNVKNIRSMSELMGALDNCQCIWQQIHPMDYGTTAIIRFLRDRIHHAVPNKKMTNLYQICAFFQAAMKVNADRVLGPENPMTYAEIVSMYNAMDWNTYITEVVSSPIKADRGRKYGYKRQGADLEHSNKKKEMKGVDVCYPFNTEKGCNRTSGESGSSISATTFSKTVTSVEPRIMEMKITLNKMMVKCWFPLKDIHVVIVTYNV